MSTIRLFEQVQVGDKALVTNSVLFADVSVGDKVRLTTVLSTNTLPYRQGNRSASTSSVIENDLR